MTLCQRGYFIQIFHPAQGRVLFFKWKLYLESIHSFSALVGFVDDLGEVIKNKKKGWKNSKRVDKELVSTREKSYARNSTEGGLWGGKKNRKKRKMMIFKEMKPYPQLQKRVISQYRQIIGMRILGTWQPGLGRFSLTSWHQQRNHNAFPPLLPQSLKFTC